MNNAAIKLLPYNSMGSYPEWEDEDSVARMAFIPARKAPFVSAARDHASHMIVLGYADAALAKHAARHRMEARPADQLRSLNHTLNMNRKQTDFFREDKYPKAYAVMGYLVVVIIVSGIILTAIKPSEITELGVPVGLTLWAVLAHFLRRRDRRNVHA